jgi:outer membrane protein assembly factor BamB
MCRTATAIILLGGLTGIALVADLNEELWSAAKKGDAAAVEAILSRGADINAKTPYGATALFFAADKGHAEAVRVLLKHKADPNVKDTFYQSSVLNWASSKGHAEIVGALLESGATGADEVLRGAASQGRVEVVRAVLEKGKVKEETLNRALSAAPKDKPEIAELLTKAGAKPAAPAAEAPPEAREKLGPFEGTYRGDDGQELGVAVADGKLSLTFDGRAILSLSQDGENTFKGSGDDGLVVKFQRDGDKAAAFTLTRGTTNVTYKRAQPPAEVTPKAAAVEDDEPGAVAAPQNWPSFRGPGASGVADGQRPPTTWDAEKGLNVRWKTPIPGLGHSCPVVWQDRIYLTTAVSGDPKSEFRAGLYGDVASVDDSSQHTWHVYCLDKQTGKIGWEQTAHRGVPKVKRHTKASHANCTPATDGAHVVVNLGSEGLYCYDPDGKLLWKRDLGTLDSGWFFDADYQWGFGSSPIIYRGLIITQCDLGKNSFIAAFDVNDGKEVWRTAREEIPSWGTPTLVEGPERVELVTSATKFARGYDPLTGSELWRLGRHSEITVPTPVFGQGLIFITSGYRPVQPIYAVKPGASGDITLKEGEAANDSVAWSTTKSGPYMPTPIVYGDYLYTCSNNGLVTCYEASTGKQIYKERLGGKGGYTASPVAADGRLYFAGEESGVRVVKAGPKFELLAANPMGEVCMATPAISEGMIFVRTQHHLFGIGRTAAAKAPK